MEVQRHIAEDEKYMNLLKLQLVEEKKEIEGSHLKFSHLLSKFYQKATSGSIIHSIFNDDESEGFMFPSDQQEQRRKQLAEERRAEYNAYLEKKEAQQQLKQRATDSVRNTVSKSLLEYVDYQKILARRKDEEAKFRSLNRTDIPHSPECNLMDKITKSENIVPSATDFSAEKPFRKDHNETLPNQINALTLDLEKLNREETRICNISSNSDLSSRSFPLHEEIPLFRRTGGGGEPVRDAYGNLITVRGFRKNSSPVNIDPLSIIPLMEEIPKKNTILYREELQKQIEEKKQLEILEKEKVRQLEEKIAQRIEEQRKQMQQEYENELKKSERIKEEFKRQQERAQRLEEFQRKEAEMRRKKFQESKTNNEKKQTEDKENSLTGERSKSPPVPAVRTKVMLDRAISPAVTTLTLNEVKSDNAMDRLTEIRKTIMKNQQKLQNEQKHTYEVMNRRTVQEVSDDDDDLIQENFPSYQRKEESSTERL